MIQGNCDCFARYNYKDCSECLLLGIPRLLRGLQQQLHILAGHLRYALNPSWHASHSGGDFDSDLVSYLVFLEPRLGRGVQKATRLDLHIGSDKLLGPAWRH
jgi:hypothetical protein